MNYLAHIFLSDSRECMLGNFLGDFVKGLIDAIPFEGDIKKGIILHREIDAFTDNHNVSRNSMRKFEPKHHIYSGIIVDIVYDHFLAKNWEKYSTQTLEDFADEAYSIFEENFDIFPETMKKFVPRMTLQNWLVSYRRKDTISLVLERTSKKLKHKNTIAQSFDEFEENYIELEQDFLIFFPELIQFSKDFSANYQA